MDRTKDLVSLYLKDIRQYEILTKEEELKLLIAAKNGCEESKEKLILSNLRLVVNVAKKYTRNGRVLVEDVYDFNTGPLGKKMQKAFELREAGDEEGYEKLSSEALKGQTHLGQLRVWAAALGVPQGEGTRFTLDLGEAP